MRDIGDEVVLGLLRLDDELLFVGDLLHLPVGVVVHAVHERRQRFELGAGRRDALSPRASIASFSTGFKTVSVKR